MKKELPAPVGGVSILKTYQVYKHRTPWDGFKHLIDFEVLKGGRSQNLKDWRRPNFWGPHKKYVGTLAPFGSTQICNQCPAWATVQLHPLVPLKVSSPFLFRKFRNEILLLTYPWATSLPRHCFEIHIAKSQCLPCPLRSFILFLRHSPWPKTSGHWKFHPQWGGGAWFQRLPSLRLEKKHIIPNLQSLPTRDSTW